MCEMLNKQFLRRKVHYEETGTCAGRRHGAEPGPDGLRRQHVLDRYCELRSRGLFLVRFCFRRRSGLQSGCAAGQSSGRQHAAGHADGPHAVFPGADRVPRVRSVQQATVEANGEAWAVDAATYIGNGPYKIAEWVPSSHITMVKNENYWNVDSLAGRTPCSSR